MYSKNDLISGILIFLVTFVVYRESPVHEVYDSSYEMLFTQQLLWKHRLSLDAAAFPQLKSHQPGQLHRRGVDLTYHLVQDGDRFYYFFPPGSVILSMPYVAIANAVGISASDKNGVYDLGGEKQIQAGLAALLMAGLSVLIFLTGRLLLPFWWSVLIAAAAAFGTPMWSIASRSLWIHTWGIFVLGFIIWLMVRAEVKLARLSPVVLGTCVSWLYFIRPTLITSIVAIAVFVLVYHRNLFVPFVLTGFVWLAMFVAYSYCLSGQPLPLYYTSHWGDFRDSRNFLEGFAGSLVSPARGLLIYVPVVGVVFYLVMRHRKNLRLNLAILAGAVICLHLVLISAFGPWDGGHCYGPRYSTDIVPWLALLAIIAIDARLRSKAVGPAQGRATGIWLGWTVAGLLLAWSILLNGIGAIWLDAWRWNSQPNDIDKYHARLWDWRHPPFFGVPPN